VFFFRNGTARSEIARRHVARDGGAGLGKTFNHDGTKYTKKTTKRELGCALFVKFCVCFVPSWFGVGQPSWL
jgi:hypothetical protein